ncbi:MAG: M24 family metallopeptidase [Phycisphaerales bacterium]|nr:M24 family metallopeptidase [Phycisphaerales bacterium]
MVTEHSIQGLDTQAQPRSGVVTSVRLAESLRTASRTRGGEIHTDSEIGAIREAAYVARLALDAALRAAKPGVTPASLAAIVGGVVAAERAESALNGVTLARRAAFPAACCIGVNDRFVHAVPSDEPLADGDVVTIDVAISLRGWCADLAECTVIGRGNARTHAMVEGCYEMLNAAMTLMAPGVRWSVVAAAMQQVASDRSLGIVTSLSGHGIGRRLHEAPIAPCSLDRALVELDDFTLLPGMVICVEPVVTEHADGVRSVDSDGFAVGVELVPCEDGWSMRTSSGRSGCAVERTVVVTRSGCERLDEVPPSPRATTTRRV